MASRGRVQLGKILEMLKECAPGHEIAETTHHYRIQYEGRTYPSFPQGAHGRNKQRAEIEFGHIRKMVRYLKIDKDCAARMLPEVY